MNTYKKMRNILNGDRSLVIMLGGIVISGMGLISVMVTAGIWYL
jgi:hypothetical protein